jgi:dienelactone hydrolase
LSPLARKLAVAIAAAALWLLVAVPASGAATVRNYNLGDTTIPDPGPDGPLPIRLWGVIGVPDGPGRHPIVVVAHGRHGDNCPRLPGSVPTFQWPCFDREQRNDFGLRHIVRALAERGVAAIAPDLNGAFTFGWGPADDERRWPRIVDRTLLELATDVDEGGSRFGLPLGDRIDLTRIGLLGHSRSGHHIVRLARSRADDTSASEVGAGQGPVDALLPLAPVYRGAGLHGRVPLPDLPTAIVLSRCDGDVPRQGRRYFTQAQNDENRTEPVFLVRLEQANHTFYNRTLSEIGLDDGVNSGAPGCSKRERLKPAAQQAWIDKFASSFFAAELDGAARPSWMRLQGPAPTRLYGLAVAYDRFVP